MHYVSAPRRLLTCLLVLAIATVIVQSAAARMAPPEPAAPASSTIVIGTGAKVALKKPATKKHRSPARRVAPSTPATTATNWAIPSGCTLGLGDGYVWGYSC
jgi:hypothetical protein